MHESETHRMTRQRKLILEELRKRVDHPSADMIYEAVRSDMPHISLGTIYRNLELLHRFGLIQKIDTGTGQARYDGNPQHHYHAVCNQCERVLDVDEDAVKTFEYDATKVGLSTVSGHIVHFTGICDECQSGAT